MLIVGDVLSPPQKQRFQVKTLTAKISFPLDIQKMLRMKMPWMMNLNSSILTAQLHSDMSWQLDCKQLLEKSNISFPLVLFTTWIFAGKGLNIRPCLKVSSSSQGVYKSNLTSFSLFWPKSDYFWGQYVNKIWPKGGLLLFRINCQNPNLNTTQPNFNLVKFDMIIAVLTTTTHKLFLLERLILTKLRTTQHNITLLFSGERGAGIQPPPLG